MGFKIGSFVALRGLKRIDFNGKLASIKAEAEGNRYVIELIEEKITISVRQENLSYACYKCHKADAAQFCGKCRFASYCSGECQRIHWKVHKAICFTLGCQRSFQRYPLFEAACAGNLSAAKRVIEEGADIDKEGVDQQTPLIVAASKSGYL